MELLPLSFLAGVLTIFSPCVFTLLPVILNASSSSRSWRRPVTIILSLLFSVGLFTLALKSSTYFVAVPPQVWEYLSGGILIVFGITLLFPMVWEKFFNTLPFSNVASNVLSESAQKETLMGDVVIGAALGPVFSSCSPTYAIIIATILPTSFSLGFLHLLLYLSGMGIVLVAIALTGQRLVSKLKWAVDPRGWFKKLLGIIFILFGLLISTGLEKRFGSWLLEQGYFNATNYEVSLLDDQSDSVYEKSTTDVKLSVNKPYVAPELQNIEAWINSEGLTLEELKGKVVLIDFWTYSCINCIRTIPFVQGWYDKYKDEGFVVIGVHAPEFAFERKLENVQDAVKEYGITYPVALDNDFSTWRAYENRFWPAHYFIDKNGLVRHTHFGEGKYEESEAVIRQLLELDTTDEVSIEYQVPIARGQTPETYLGSARIKNFANSYEYEPDTIVSYTLRERLKNNEWSLGGKWEVQEERSVAKEDGAKLLLQFNARDVYLVMDTEDQQRKFVDVRVNRHTQHLGRSVDYNGKLVVDSPELYHLVSSDSSEPLDDTMLELSFEEGVAIYAFTFGS